MPTLTTAQEKALPRTLQRSCDGAQRTFTETLESAQERYDDASRAYRAAYSALKHSYEKIGDHWEAKSEKGPSDERARSGGPNASGRARGGVNATASKAHLYDVARRLGIPGRARMDKPQLVDAIEAANAKRTRAR